MDGADSTAIRRSRKRGRHVLRDVAFLCLGGVIATSYVVPTFITQDDVTAAQHSNGQLNVLTRSQLSSPAPDGFFNNERVYYRKHVDHSSVHCVGETHARMLKNVDDSWQYRSCKFQNLCFDVAKKEYVLFQSPAGQTLLNMLERSQQGNISVSTLMSQNTEVSLGGINAKWGSGKDRLKWFPRIISPSSDEYRGRGYYALSDDIVLIPHHQLNGMNPGHLVWDDFLPIFNLLRMFYGSAMKQRPLLIRTVLDPPLWATCDTMEWRKEVCAKVVPKFLPLMAISGETYFTTGESFLNVTHGLQKSDLICGANGAAGMGALTDHGPTKLHGWQKDDYDEIFNHGRGPLLLEFRNYMLQNIGIPWETPMVNKDAKFRITFATNSSRFRVTDFQTHVDALNQSVLSDEIEIHRYKMSDLSLKDQVSIASNSAIYITAAGGGAVTGMFLPEGASLIVFYAVDGGRIRNKPTGLPALLDFDILNNLSYIRVHWIPMPTEFDKSIGEFVFSPLELETFVELVKHELHQMRRSRSS